MHYLVCLIGTVALLSVSSAAGIRPILRISSRAPEELSLRRGYQEQDTARAFYSYGYSDENAARAEYTTRDGSSRGFYSYVDANGKLQTVQYEAGGSRGFQVEASNQPKAPVDDKKPPLPVTDTLEVQQAREAHLNALKEAQAEARREGEEQQQQEEQERQQEQQKGTRERTLSDEDADILERVRAELTSMLEDRQREESRLREEDNRQEEATDSTERAQSQDDEQEQRQEEQQQSRQEQRLQTANDAKDLRLRTVYTLADLSSSSYLKLSDLGERLDRNSQDLRIPIGAYYAYVSPNAKYSVTTPTELRTLRPIALSRSLQLSKQNEQRN